jgi:AAA family ATP:ADP antiporter
VILASSLIVFNVIDLRERSRGHRRGVTEKDAQIGRGSAFGLVLHNRYLLLVAVMILLLNWVNATGEYILSSIVQRAAEERVTAGELARADEGAYIGSFYAGYFQVVNVVGMLLQLFVVSRLVKHLGVGVAVCVLPVIALGSYAVAALLPSLVVMRWVKTAENSVDYSLQNTVRQMLFLPTTRVEKYKAKQVIDSFVVRAGDVLSSATVFIGSALLALGTAGFAWINVVLVLFWLVAAVLVGREFRRRTDSGSGGSV